MCCPVGAQAGMTLCGYVWVTTDKGHMVHIRPSPASHKLTPVMGCPVCAQSTGLLSCAHACLLCTAYVFYALLVMATNLRWSSLRHAMSCQMYLWPRMRTDAHANTYMHVHACTHTSSSWPRCAYLTDAPYGVFLQPYATPCGRCVLDRILQACAEQDHRASAHNRHASGQPHTITMWEAMFAGQTHHVMGFLNTAHSQSWSMTARSALRQSVSTELS